MMSFKSFLDLMNEDKDDFNLEPEQDSYDQMVNNLQQGLDYKKRLTAKEKAVLDDPRLSAYEKADRTGLPYQYILRKQGEKKFTGNSPFASAVKSIPEITGAWKKYILSQDEETKKAIISQGTNTYTLADDTGIPLQMLRSIRLRYAEYFGNKEQMQQAHELDDEKRMKSRSTWDKPHLPTPEEEKSYDDFETRNALRDRSKWDNPYLPDPQEDAENLKNFKAGQAKDWQSWSDKVSTIPGHDPAKNFPIDDGLVKKGTPDYYERVLDKRRAGRRPKNIQFLTQNVKNMNGQGYSDSAIALNLGLNLKWVEDILERMPRRKRRK